MQTRITIVGEPDPAFVNQMKLLVYSLRANGGGLSDAPVSVAVNGREMDAADRSDLEQFGDVAVRVMPRHYGWLFANKFNALFPQDPFDVLLYLDCDTCVMDDLAPMVAGLTPNVPQFRGRVMGASGSQNAGPLEELIREFGTPDGKTPADVSDASFPRSYPLFNCGVMVMTRPAAEIIRYHAPQIAHELVSRRASSAVESLPGLFRETAHRISARLFPNRERTTYAYWVAEQMAVAFSLTANDIAYERLDRMYNWEHPESPPGRDLPALFHYLKGRHDLDRARLFDGPWQETYANGASAPRQQLAALARACASSLGVQKTDATKAGATKAGATNANAAKTDAAKPDAATEPASS